MPSVHMMKLMHSEGIVLLCGVDEPDDITALAASAVSMPEL